MLPSALPAPGPGHRGTALTDSTATEGLFAGVDVGASTAKAVVIDASGTVLGQDVRPSGMDFTESGHGALDAALAAAGHARDELTACIATGYGRNNVPAATGTRTEIAAHGRGAYHHHPHALTVVDVGGQDNKIIKLDEDGKRTGFRMNRKCAAGTGAFIEELAHRIGVPLEEMEPLARKSRERVEIGSFCTVFSATEILSLIRRGAAVEDIVKAVFRSVAQRVAEMGVVSGTVVATGGVAAHNPIILDLLSEELETEVVAPPLPQITGALGAAIYAREAAQ